MEGGNIMTMAGVPAGGFRTVGEIDGTNGLRFQPKETALSIALELLSSHTSGAPIVNDAGKFVGFVSEFDLLGAIESGQDLSKITADTLMNKEHFVADESTTIADAIQLMKEKHLLNIPVIKQGRVAYSITRHDLLRARIGLGPGIET
jgi:CBS domain-containing protein